jgi:hypothetical protein
MRGRAGDYWHRMVERLPLPRRLALLQWVGFHGVILDRRALRDGGESCERTLKALGLEGPLGSSDGSLGFYRMRTVALSLDDDEMLLPVPGAGFSPPEGHYPHHWSWSNGPAELLIHNFNVQPRDIELTFTLTSLIDRLVTVRPGPIRVMLRSGSTRSAVRLPITVRPGWNAIELDTDQPPVKAAGDNRPLAFRVGDIHVLRRQ